MLAVGTPIGRVLPAPRAGNAQAWPGCRLTPRGASCQDHVDAGMRPTAATLLTGQHIQVFGQHRELIND